MAATFGASYGSQVKEHLRNAIITGDLEPGERINEVKLAEKLGISRTPLREAVSALASEGWIDQTPHKGARVAEFKPAVTEELLAVREVLEVGALNLLLQRSDRASAIARLTEVAQLTSEALVARSFYPETGSDFHLCLLAESGNATLFDLGRSVHSKIRAVRFRSGVAANRRDAAIDEHQEIVSALMSGDHVKAEASLKQHLTHAAAQIRNS